MENQLKRQYFIVYIFLIIFSIFMGGVLLYGGLSNSFQYPMVGNIGGILMIVLGLFFLYRLLTMDHLIMIKDYINKNPQITMKDIENDFNQTIKFGSRVWLGSRWTFYMDEGGLPNILENYDIIWAYFHREHHGKTSAGYIYIYNTLQELIKVPISKKNAKLLLQEYENNYSHIVTGYSNELNNLYSKEYDSFLKLRYRNNAKI